MNKTAVFCYFLSILSHFLFGQIGGNSTYRFLNLPSSARIGALGGTQIAMRDEDVSMAYQNPSLLNEGMDKQLTLNATLYFAGIKYGYAGYADHFGSDSSKNVLRFSSGIQYINYGKFIAADSTGFINGEFDADEYVMHFAVARQEGKWSYGGNLKFIYSALEQNYSSAVAVDLAATYAETDGRWIIAMVIKNIGAPIKSYIKDNPEKLPYEIQLGFSRKLEHLPLCLSVTAHHLQQFNIRYDDPNDTEHIALFSTDTARKGKKYIIDKIARHFIIGGEFTIAKVARLDLAYNHLRRQELRMSTKSGWAGFSFGMGFKIKKFNLHYGRAIYHVAGGTNHFSLAMNIAGFFKSRPIPFVE